MFNKSFLITSKWTNNYLKFMVFLMVKFMPKKPYNEYIRNLFCNFQKFKSWKKYFKTFIFASKQWTISKTSIPGENELNIIFCVICDAQSNQHLE